MALRHPRNEHYMGHEYYVPPQRLVGCACEICGKGTSTPLTQDHRVCRSCYRKIRALKRFMAENN